MSELPPVPPSTPSEPPASPMPPASPPSVESAAPPPPAVPPPVGSLESPPPKKGGISGKQIAIGAGIAVVACCLLLVCILVVVALVGGDKGIPFGLPTSTSKPRATSAPVATPEPTEEIAEPLSVEAYGLAVTGPLFNIAGALQELQSLTSQAADDPSLMLDDDWKAKVNTQADIVKANHEAIAELVPPDDLADMHTTLVDGTQDCNDAMDHLTDGIDQMEPDEISTATDLLQSCTDKISIAEDKLKEYTDSH